MKNSFIEAHPRITLQEEPDKWGFLYDPEIDFSLCVNPESVFLWKQLEKKTTIQEIALKIKNTFTDVPQDIETIVAQQINGFINLGFVIETPGSSDSDNPGCE